MKKIQNRIFIIIGVLIGLLLFLRIRNINQTAIINYIFLFCIILYILVKGLKQKYLLNPYNLFLITPITLLIYDINVSNHYLVELRQDTYNFILYNFVCLLLGFYIGEICILSCRKKASIWCKGENLNGKQYTKHAYRMILFGMIPTAFGCLSGLGYLTSLKLNELKSVINSVPLASIFQLFLYPAIICAFFSKKRKTIVIVLGLALFALVVNFSKTTVVMLSISILLSYYNQILEKRTSLKKFFILMIIALVVLFYSFDIYNNIRHDYDTKSYFNSLGYIGDISQDWFLPIMYLISPWGNVQYVIDTVTNHTLGLWAIKPFLGYFQLDGLFGNTFTLVPRYTAFNTFSYISVFYIDFGFIGSGIASIILGIFIMSIYKMFIKHRNSPLTTAIYALNAYAIVMLFFNNHYLQLSYPITVILIMFIYSKLFMKKG